MFAIQSSNCWLNWLIYPFSNRCTSLLHLTLVLSVFCFTLQSLYVLGTNSDRTLWRLLKIDRSEPSELVIDECSTVYTESEHPDLLKGLDDEHRSTGGVKFVTKFYGIIGKCYFPCLFYKPWMTYICTHIWWWICFPRFYQIPWAILHVDYYWAEKNRGNLWSSSVSGDQDFNGWISKF